MENFASILERDYGFKSGKNAPMVSGSAGGSGSGTGYSGLRKTVPGSRMSANAGSFGQEDPFGVGRKNEGQKSSRSSYGSRDDLFTASSFDDVFGGPPKSSDGGARYDDVFQGTAQGGGAPQGTPVFDEWGGFGGSTPKVNKSTSGSFHSSPRPSDRNHFIPTSEPVFDELIPGFGFLPKSRTSTEMKSTHHEPDPFVSLGNDPVASNSVPGSSTFDDDGLLPGFDSQSRSSSLDAKTSHQPDPLMPLFDEPTSSSIPPASPSPLVDDGLLPGFGNEDAKSESFRGMKGPHGQDSFGSLGDDPVLSSMPSTSPPFDDLLNVFDEPQVPPSSSTSRAPGNGVKQDRFDAFDSFPPSPGKSSFYKDSSRKPAEDTTGTGSMEEAIPVGGGFSSDGISEVSPDSDPFFPSQPEVGKSATGLGSSEKPVDDIAAWDIASSDDQQVERGSSGNSRSWELRNAWLTIEDMKLQTRPSGIPPPSRPPPSLPGSKEKLDARDAEFVTSSSSTSTPEEDRIPKPTPPPYEQAVPGWMDFKIPVRDEERDREARAARERRRQEREEAKAKASRENRDRESRDREMKDRQAREQERLRREKEREKDRAAVRIATLEARERAAQEAREKAQRSAVERVTGEARERAASQARARVERAAVDRANAEARERAEVRAAVERAAAEARERSERAAAEKAAVERAAADARERSARIAAEKVAVERAQSEARERAARVAAEKAAVERAAAEARERAEKVAAEKAQKERYHQQHKSENDLESFFGRSSSEQRQRPASMNNNSGTSVFGEPRRSSSGTAATSASMDDWEKIFGGPSSNSDAPTDSRRGDNAKSSSRRTERNLHSSQRAAQAIAEINQRDLEAQREQAERQRAGDALDGEIKRWASGKEGNLRALLSTLQYVLWPECGWTPISLTDLINPAAVKKTYKKATLYVHPDKVQQKGATVQQKYIAEKVFDLLKEAFNKFNSEELF